MVVMKYVMYAVGFVVDVDPDQTCEEPEDHCLNYGGGDFLPLPIVVPGTKTAVLVLSPLQRGTI